MSVSSSPGTEKAGRKEGGEGAGCIRNVINMACMQSTGHVPWMKASFRGDWKRLKPKAGEQLGVPREAWVEEGSARLVAGGAQGEWLQERVSRDAVNPAVLTLQSPGATAAPLLPLLPFHCNSFVSHLQVGVLRSLALALLRLPRTRASPWASTPAVPTRMEACSSPGRSLPTPALGPGVHSFMKICPFHSLLFALP